MSEAQQALAIIVGMAVLVSIIAGLLVLVDRDDSEGEGRK
jgi:hypothetical protein